jgi:hypothetical protein
MALISNGVANVKAVSGGVGDGPNIWWGGMALATKQVFGARATAPVSFEIDRLAHVGTGEERRSAILIADASRTNWVMFSENDLNGGWVVDLSTGTLRQNNTGIAAFADSKYRDGGKHRMKLLANGSTVKLYLDGVFGVEVPFTLTQGIIFEFGVYARSYPDSILATFDNAVVTGPIPPIYNAPASVTFEADQTTNEIVTVIVPAQLHQSTAGHVTIASSSPAVAVPAGGSGGSLTLTFAAGGPDIQTFEVARVGAGIAIFTFSNDMGAASTNTLQVIVQDSQPKVLLSDSFDSGTLSSSWVVDPALHFEPGYASAADVTAAINLGMLELNVAVTASYWPGVQVLTATNFRASLVEPVTLEIDRVSQPGGTTGTRAGVYIYAGTNFVWFGDNAEGTLNWGYNWEIGIAGDSPNNTAVQIAAFGDALYRDAGNHRIKMVANGETVSLYLDGVFGIAVPFPFSTDLKFGIMAAARAQGDYVTADFDNVLITGSDKPAAPAQMTVTRQNGDIVISWTGTGTLEQADTLTGSWSNIPGAPNPYTIPANALGAQKFYRLLQ